MCFVNNIDPWEVHVESELQKIEKRLAARDQLVAWLSSGSLVKGTKEGREGRVNELLTLPK